MRTRQGGKSCSIVCGNARCNLRTDDKRWEADGCGELGEALALVYGATVVEQCCIFHKLKNVADKCREELKGEKKQERKKLMEQASAIYQAESATQARQRLATFAQTWPGQTPKTVAT